MSNTTDQQAPAGPPKAGPQHALMKPFVGTFRAVVKLWMGPGEPMVSTGTMINFFQLDGLYLHQDYTGDAAAPNAPAFCGRGYWGFNFATGKYEGFWIDNASPMMQIEVGDVDPAGREWTMLAEIVNPQTGEQMTKKSIITLIDENHHSMQVMFVDADGGEFKAMEIQYTRE